MPCHWLMGVPSCQFSPAPPSSRLSRAALNASQSATRPVFDVSLTPPLVAQPYEVGRAVVSESKSGVTAWATFPIGSSPPARAAKPSTPTRARVRTVLFSLIESPVEPRLRKLRSPPRSAPRRAWHGGPCRFSLTPALNTMSIRIGVSKASIASRIAELLDDLQS